MKPSADFPPLVVSSVLIISPKPGDSPQVVCYATVTLNDAVRVCSCKLIRCANGHVRFFGPQRTDRQHGRVCLVQPLDDSVRRLIEQAVLDAYRAHETLRANDASIGRVARYEMTLAAAPASHSA